MKTSDVIVVGGGIGGLSAAFALARIGLQVTVLEKAAEFGEVGAGLQIAPNCTRILDDYGLLDEAKELGVVPETMVMRDAVDNTELTRLDLQDLDRRYGFPYMVIHRSDLHGIFLRACERAGVTLRTGQKVVGYDQTDGGASVKLADGTVLGADVVIAADGLHSIARRLIVEDEPVSSAYVAYRGAVPVEEVHGLNVDLTEVSLHVGPACHFVRYGLRGGDMVNQVAVFESPKAVAGQDDWGTPDELDHAFDKTCEQVRAGVDFMWRDRWWPMYDRDPIMTWVTGRIALLGDAAHPPLQYMAQGAVMAIEDGWVLAQHVAAQHAATAADIDWPAALSAYEAVRPEHCRRVLTTARAWGQLWHLEGVARRQRNQLLRLRDTFDYGFVDWIYGPTALLPEQEPAMFEPIPLASADGLVAVQG